MEPHIHAGLGRIFILSLGRIFMQDWGAYSCRIGAHIHARLGRIFILSLGRIFILSLSKDE